MCTILVHNLARTVGRVYIFDGVVFWFSGLAVSVKSQNQQR